MPPVLPSKLSKKLESKSHPRIFLGYSNESKAYRVWDKITKRVVISGDFLFHENTTSDTSATPATMYVPLLFQQAAFVPAVVPAIVLAPPTTSVQVPNASVTRPSQAPSRPLTSSATVSSAITNSSTAAPAINARLQRTRKVVHYYEDWTSLAIAIVTEPKTHQQTTANSDCVH